MKITQTHHLHLSQILPSLFPNLPKTITWFGTINIKLSFKVTIFMGLWMEPTSLPIHTPPIATDPETLRWFRQDQF
jgi:hypothetical protein